MINISHFFLLTKDLNKTAANKSDIFLAVFLNWKIITIANYLSGFFVLVKSAGYSIYRIFIY
jgi:hypothetical protein